MDTETELRRHDHANRWSVMGGIVWLLQKQGRRLRFWAEAAETPPAELLALDLPRECCATALEASVRWGYPVCAGWVASDSHPQPVRHFWNLTTAGEVLDAAEARREGRGWLGLTISAEMHRHLRARNPYPPVRTAA